MSGFQGGETAWVATRKRDLVKDAPQKWPCLDAREKILIAPRLEFPRDRWRFMLALVLITPAGWRSCCRHGDDTTLTARRLK